LAEKWSSPKIPVTSSRPTPGSFSIPWRSHTGQARGHPRNSANLNRLTSFLNLRVADIWACHQNWRAKGAVFLTEPRDNDGWEWRCYMRDPDGYIIEVGQYTPASIERFKSYAT